VRHGDVTPDASPYRDLYDFRGGNDGASPQSGLLLDGSGDLIGVTNYGGSASCGTVFELSPSGGSYSEKIIYSFGIEPDGCAPVGIIADAGGNLYVTTLQGGLYNGGAAIELSPTSKGDYQETAVHSFGNFPDGKTPWGKLIQEGSTFYTTTNAGGQYGFGTIVVLGPGLTETAVYNIPSSDLSGPNSSLAADSSGALYGTTEYGGGFGGVFRFDPSSGNLAEIWQFTNQDDGALNPTGGVWLDAAGTVYGTTEGGTGGTVYRLLPKGGSYQLNVLHQFLTQSDGLFPLFAGLTPDGPYLYGATLWGGDTSGACSVGIGCGTVFRLKPSGAGFTVLERFDGTDGSVPVGGLTADGKFLYGTASSGGAFGDGVVYRLRR
jgi:uncharacterized repeat protein (TIGR03803 family)